MTGKTGLLILAARLLPLQTLPTAAFEVASVKPGTDCRQGGSEALSPARLDLKCQTVMNLIRMAYVTALQPVTAVALPGIAVQITGGPSWITSDPYDIDAKAEGAPGQRAMRGPMLQALLEDRFRLKIHRETREGPVYVLTVAKGGVKRLQPAQEGKCVVLDRTVPQAERPPADAHLCGGFYPAANHDGSRDMYGVTMADVCRQFTVLLHQTVVDKTSIAGKFDIHFAPLPARSSDEPMHWDEFADILLRQLNLKIESAKSPGEFLVIDRVERPSGN